MIKSKQLLWFLAVCGLLASLVLLPQEQSRAVPASQTEGIVPPMNPQPKLVRVSSGVMSKLLLKRVSPQYPEEAWKAGIQGTVNLEAVISKHGDIADLRLVSGHPALVEAAMKAVKKWKYRPYTLNGEPVDVQTTLQVNFSLADR